MLKRLVNEARINLTIETQGPLLVKSGHATLSKCDMAPVRTIRGGKPEVFIPGSSIKGVLRSHLERISRSLNPGAGVVCNPFRRVRVQDLVRLHGNQVLCAGYEEAFCGNKFEVRKNEFLRATNQIKIRNLNPEKRLDSETAYKDSCPICRLFGSTSFIGRLSIEDAYLSPESRATLDTRQGVGIDRLTGGASNSALFDLEAVSSGVRFSTGLYLRNFECWQLGALLILLRDLHDGLIRIGSGRSRGMGKVTGLYSEVQISRIGGAGADEPGNEIAGLGRVLGNGSYGTSVDDVLVMDNMASPIDAGIRKVWTWSGESLQELEGKAAKAFVDTIESWRPPATMQWSHFQWESELVSNE